MHSAKEDAQCPRPGPIPNLLAVFSHAARTFVHVGELANFSCAVSVDCGLGRSDADLVGAERSRRALTSFRFGVAARGLSTSSPPDMDLSCLPIVPPVLPAWASAEDAFANARCDRASKAIPIDACRIILPPGSWRYRTCQIGALEGPVCVRSGSNTDFPGMPAIGARRTFGGWPMLAECQEQSTWPLPRIVHINDG